MKNILKISLFALFAVTPLIASAAEGDPSTTLTVDSGKVGLAAADSGVVIAGAGGYYKGETITNADKTAAASAAYVKGAYNDAIAAINKTAADVGALVPVVYGAANTNLSNITATGKSNISEKGTVDLTKTNYGTGTVGKALVDIKTSADDAVKTVKVNGTALTETEGAVNITVAEGTGNGTIKVNGSDVTVHGLGSAAYTASTAYATSGQGTKADNAVQGVKVNGTALTEDANHDVNITVATGTSDGSIKVNGTDVAVKNVATQAGVTATISASHVPIMVNWGDSTANTTNVALVGATYTAQ